MGIPDLREQGAGGTAPEDLAANTLLRMILSSMAFRFFRRLRIAPGVTLNLSKRGGSLSFGPRGAKLTAGTSGVRRTLSLPGTGLWYTEQLGTMSSRRKGRAAPPAPRVRPQDRLTLGFFKRLITPADERDLVDGMREFSQGRPEKAYAHLRKAGHPGWTLANR